MKTILVAEASAWLDFRLVPDQHPAAVLALLKGHLEREGFADIEVTLLGAAEPAGTPIDHPFVQRVARVAAETSGVRPSIVPRMGGTLPIIASIQRRVNIPGLSAPGNPFYFGAHVHGPNEHIRLDDIDPAVRFTHALLEDLAR